jgi:hypothetical protein
MNNPLVTREMLTWKITIQWIVAILATGLIALLTFSREGWIFLLSYVDLGVHELGHMLTFWAPELMCQAAGSFLQVAVPVAFAVYFFLRHDRFAVVFAVAWAAESLNNVSVYIYDATRMVLPLLGDDGSGAGHDWRNILSRLGWLDHTDGIAYTVRGLSVLLFVVAFGLAVWWWVKAWRESREAGGRKTAEGTYPWGRPPEARVDPTQRLQ